MTVRKIKASLVKQELNDYIGEETYIFYDTVTGELRIWDGTPGGKPIFGGGGAGTWGSITGDINTQTDLITLFGNYIPLSQKGVANGVATLDAGGLVPASQLPSYVDDVLEYANFAAFPGTGETGKIYVDLATNNTYRWSGSVYVSLSSADTVNELAYLRTFVGKNAAGSELPVYTSTNYVTQNNALEAAIGELDSAIQTVATASSDDAFIRAFIGKGLTGAETPTYSSTVYVTQNGDLEAAIGELDAAINTVSTSIPNNFGTIAVSGQNNVVADAISDTLTLAAGAGITLTTNDVTDTVTIAYDGTTADQNLFETIVSDSGSTTANTTTDSLTIAGGAGISTSIVGDVLTIANTSPNVDQNLFSALTVSDTDAGYTWSATGSISADNTTDSATFVSGAGINIDVDPVQDAIRITNTSPNIQQNAFTQIAVSGQNTVVADGPTDILTLVAGSNVTITTNDATDTITISSSGGAGGTQNLFETIAVTDTDTGYTWASIGSVVADLTTDTLTLVSGANINIDVDATLDAIRITNTSPNVDQNLWATIAADTGSTTANTTTDTLTVSGGTGIDTSIAGDALTVTLNAALNQLNDVVITAVTDNEILGWDLATGDWINQTPAELGLATTTDLGSYVPLSQKGVANGVATLDAGAKIPTSQLPALALTDVWVVGSEAAQLALVAQEGDIAIRTDLNKSYAHNGGVAGTMADWSELLTPVDAVLSVNGQTGTVSINLWSTFTADVGSTTANTTTDNLTIAGGTGITTTITGDVVTITNNSPNVAQNVFETINADSGSTTADLSNDALTIAGGAGITTSITGDTVTIAATGQTDTNTFNNVTTTTQIDSVTTVMAKWMVRAVEVATPTNILAEEIVATHDGTSTKISIGPTLKMGTTISGLTYTVTLTGGNTLQLNVASTAAVNVDVKRIATL